MANGKADYLQLFDGDFGNAEKAELLVASFVERIATLEAQLEGAVQAVAAEQEVRKELEGERDNAFSECRAIHRIEKERAMETMALKRKQKKLEEQLISAHLTWPMTMTLRIKRWVEKHK